MQKIKKKKIGNNLEINEKISILNLQDNKYMCLFELPILKNINDFRVFINENTKDIPWNTFKSLKILDINCELNLIKANRLNNQKKLKIRLKDEEIVINLLKIYFEKLKEIKSKIKASFSFYFRLITIGNVELISVPGKVPYRYFLNLDFLKFSIFPLITNLNVENNGIINVDGLIYLENLRQLNLANNEIENLDILKNKNFNKIRELNIKNNVKINNIDFLNNLTELTSLDLSGLNIDIKIIMINLHDLVNLETLHLDNFKISNLNYIKKNFRKSNLDLNFNNNLLDCKFFLLGDRVSGKRNFFNRYFYGSFGDSFMGTIGSYSNKKIYS